MMDTNSRLPPLCPPFRFANVGISLQLQNVTHHVHGTGTPSNTGSSRNLFGNFTRSSASPHHDRHVLDNEDGIDNSNNTENEAIHHPFAVHRGAYPTLNNFRFLVRLGLRSIVSVVPSKSPTADLLEFCNVEGIKNVHIKTGKPGEFNLTPQVVAGVVEHLITPENLPCYIHCTDGGYVTGRIIMILRKLQCWSYESIVQEYERYVKDQRVSEEEKLYLEHFNATLRIPTKVPLWLWQGAQFQPHPTLELLLPQCHDTMIQSQSPSEGRKKLTSPRPGLHRTFGSNSRISVTNTAHSSTTAPSIPKLGTPIATATGTARGLPRSNSSRSVKSPAHESVKSNRTQFVEGETSPGSNILSGEKPAKDSSKTDNFSSANESNLQQFLDELSNTTPRVRSGSFDDVVRSSVPEDASSTSMMEELKFMAEIEAQIKCAIRDDSLTVDTGVSRDVEGLCLETPKTQRVDERE